MTEKNDAVKQLIIKLNELVGRIIVIDTNDFKTREVIREISLTRDGVLIEVVNPAIINILGDYPPTFVSPGYGEASIYTIYRDEEGTTNAKACEVYIENS